MQTASSRIWTKIAESIFYKDNHYAMQNKSYFSTLTNSRLSEAWWIFSPQDRSRPNGRFYLVPSDIMFQFVNGSAILDLEGNAYLAPLDSHSSNVRWFFMQRGMSYFTDIFLATEDAMKALIMSEINSHVDFSPWNQRGGVFWCGSK